MKIDPRYVVLGFLILFVWSLGRFLIYRNPLDLFSVSVYMIIILFIGIRDHYNIFYSAFLGTIIFQGLILAYFYTYLDLPLQEKITYAGFFAGFILIFVYMFINRRKYLKRTSLKN
ncbi:MAG: hypothetical protein PQ968_04235 [Methanobacterium sp.]|jgi:hypothetical protein